MATNTAQIKVSRAVLAGALVAAAALLHAAPPQAAAHSTSTEARGSGSYGYPVKPFHLEHPVRGFFGDPRTVFTGPPTRATLMQGGGNFTFHEGVDISAPDGTAVYPVASGTVVGAEKREDWHVEIAAGGGVSFDYWHVRPSVRVGQHVTAYETVLGRIVRPAGHVHLTERIGGRPVNPLAPGRLAPYSDTTPPRVESISVRSLDLPAGGLASFVRGRVEIDVDAYDLPTVPVPGIWRDMPTTPALITWRIKSWTGKVVLPERAASDFRSTIPSSGSFWHVYARGTFQNMAVFGRHYSYLQRGTYLFNLTPQPLDTRTLPDGVYDVIVTATDVRGNSASRTLRFTVHNRPGWVGS
jgi:Peptidase family M23